MDRSPRVQNPAETALEQSGLSLLRLEQTTGIPRSTLRRKVAHPLSMTLDDLHRFAQATGADERKLFRAILAGGDA